MTNAIQNLFDIIYNNIVEPFKTAIMATDLFNNSINFINSILNAIFNLWREIPGEQVVYISPALLSDIIGIVFLVLFFKLVINIFTFVFKTLKTALSSSITPTATTWRNSWKRKKGKK